MRVLYVNHTAEVSGGERSLLDLLGSLPVSVLARLAAPPGQLRVAVERLGVPTTAITGAAGSLRLHPLHTPRALAEMALAAAQVRRAAHSSGAEVVHANSIRAGIVVGLARPRAVRVAHVRDCLPPGTLTTATMRLIAASTDRLIANSRYTAASVHAAAPGADVDVVYNPVDLGRWDPGSIDRDAVRAELDVPPGRLLLGVVAQLTPWKGQDTAIEALAALHQRGVDAQLLLVGSAKFIASATRFDNERYVAGLHELATRAGVADRVTWLGEREDVPRLVRALDVLLLPSWEEPFGRAVLEAMAMHVPVIATDVGGPAEVIADGEDGYLLAPRQAAAWAEALAHLAANADLRRRMGAAGRAKVERSFTVTHHVAAVLDVYERARRHASTGRGAWSRES